MSWLVSTCRDIKYLTKVVYAHFKGVDLTQPAVYNRYGINTPIVLVHGSGGNQMEWIEAEKYLETILIGYPIYAFSLDLGIRESDGKIVQDDGDKGLIYVKRIAGKNDWSIEEYMRKLQICIKTVMNERGTNEVILIGHSMGGLVSALYEKNFPQDVKKVIMITSPIRGSPLLNNWIVRKMVEIDKRGREMRCGSEFLQRLNDGLNKEKYLTIGSGNDFLVPNDYSKFDDANNHLCIDRYGHYSIVSCKEMWEKIEEYISLN